MTLKYSLFFPSSDDAGVRGTALPATRNIARGNWADIPIGTELDVSDTVSHEGALYEVIAAHTKTADSLTPDLDEDNYRVIVSSSEGVNNYTWIAYADSADGTVNFSNATAGLRSYIGIAVNKTQAVESTNPTDYTWSKIQGAPGANAKLLYLYSNRQTITFNEGEPDPVVQTTTFSILPQNLSTSNYTISMSRSDGTVINANSYLSPLNGTFTASGNNISWTGAGTSFTMTAANFKTAADISNGVIVTVTHADGFTDRISISRVSNGLKGAVGSTTAIVYAYQRAASQPPQPTTTATFTFDSGNLTGLNNGWSRTIPSGSESLWVIVATASNTGPTDTIDGNEWTGASMLATNGQASSGMSVASIFLYRRVPVGQTPTKPTSDVTFTFATGIATGMNNSWTQTIPAGTDPIWVTTATAASTGSSDTIPGTEWATPVILAQNGTAGPPGYSNAAVTIYRRSASPPPLPSQNATYTFATASLTGLNNGWSTVPPADDGNPLYASQSTASSSETTDTIAPNEWASPFVIQNAATTGSNGINSASIYLYRRVPAGTGTPSVPAGTVVYTFASGGTSGVDNGWSRTIPAGTDPIWVTTATAANTTATDNITSGEWAAPQVLAQNGTNGADGGSNSVVNSEFAFPGNPLYGWIPAWNGNSGLPVHRGVNLPGYFGQMNVGYMNIAGFPSPGLVADGYYNYAPGDSVFLDSLKKFALKVNDGDRVFASALLSPHRCNGYVVIVYYNGNGGYITDSYTSTVGNHLGGQNGNPANFVRSMGFANVPAGTRFVVITPRLESTAASSDGVNYPHLLFTQLMLCRVRPGETVAPIYTPGPLYEVGSDVATDIVGAGATFRYNAAGDPEPGQFPRTLAFKLMNRNGQIMSGITWTGRFVTGGFNGGNSSQAPFAMGTGASGLVDVNYGLEPNTRLEVIAVYAGGTRRLEVELIRQQGSAGSNVIASAGISGTTNVSSFAEMGSFTTTLPVGVTSVKISGAMSTGPTQGLNSTWGTYVTEMKWQRLVSGSWQDVTGTESGTSTVNRYGTGGAEDPYYYDSSYATLNPQATITGLSSNSQQSFRLLARKVSGPSAGTLSVQGTGALTSV